jgi:hypothetical protein
MGVLAMALALALSACSGDPESSPESSTSPDATLTEVTISCPEFEDTAKKITDAQTKLYGGTADSETIDELVAELDALKEGAPPDVQTALTDMGAGFRDAAEILENPTPQGRAELAKLAPKLAEDGQKITAYITSECG